MASQMSLKLFSFLSDAEKISIDLAALTTPPVLTSSSKKPIISPGATKDFLEMSMFSSTEELTATATATGLTMSLMQAFTSAATTQPPKASSSQSSSIAVSTETLEMLSSPAANYTDPGITFKEEANTSSGINNRDPRGIRTLMVSSAPGCHNKRA
ncbi:hypothetical protein PoB_004450200 [Plakobranchus ocellatus]|uniref:Uncharacterized protein n=1 Tax=Plakobranchus ocellatus TaxID=259542 RepID=A0AAV4BFG4_9GAST|nr:hypothetical protein PoB_004450200 [Plakobranchus ocellatus]